MSAELAIRVSTPRDAAALEALLEVSYSTLLSPSYRPELMAAALPLMTRASPALLAAGTYYLAVAGTQLVGAGGWSQERPGTGEVAAGLGHIRHFATHPSWSGRGVGRALYTACETEARRRRIQRFECYASLNGEAFYTALGFRRVRPLELQLAEGVFVPGILMGRVIDDPG